jgi:two-component sensor histidine kinase
LAEDVKRNPLQLLDCLGYYNYTKSSSNIEPEGREILDSVLKAAEYITSEYELKDVLSLLSEQVVKYMNADGCIIYLIDEETKTVIDKYELKMNSELTATFKVDVVVKIASEDDIFYSNMHEKEFATLFSSICNVKTVVCTSLRVRTRVIGVMEVYYEKYYAHSEEQTKYLITISKHAGVVIEDTRLIGRSVLLQESHHRIKNNLQSVINLISLEKQSVENGQNETLNNTLDDLISRVKSIATVHDLLSKDKKGRSVINTREIIESIASYSTLILKKVHINLHLEDILIPYNKATSISLIINELVNNCLKHAFEEDKINIIEISCKKEKESIILYVENNGKPISEDFDIEESSGIGLSIVTSIIKYEFKGSIKFMKKEEGTKVEIDLPLDRILLE